MRNGSEIKTFAIKCRRSIADKQMRREIATQLMAAMVTGARLQGIIPNADLMAEQAIVYTDALIKKLDVDKEQ